MKRFASALPLLRELWQRLRAHLDGMAPRERLALAAVGLALLGAIEVGLVWPVREQRQAITAAVTAQELAESDAQQALLDQRSAEDAALQSRLDEVDRELARHGAGRLHSEPLAAWLARALAGQAVQVVALRDLALEELDTTPASASDPGADGATSAAAGAGHTTGAVPAQHAPLYRHRYELTLGGDVDELSAAVQRLGERLLPLRIERVRLASADGLKVQATLTFVVIAAERTWITL